MKILDQIQGLWGRTLSPIEIQSIIGFTEVYDEKTILQSAMLSIDKEKPFAYMKKVLMNATTKEEEKKDNFHKSEWGKEFKENFKKEKKEEQSSGSAWLDEWIKKQNERN
jgi:hypothetical protein